MRVFIFWSARDKDIVGFSDDLTGANLPTEFAPWQRVGNTALQSGDGLAGVGAADKVMSGIERDGFFVAGSGGVQVRQCLSRAVH